MLYLAVSSDPNCFLRRSMSSAGFFFIHLLLSSWWCVFYETLQQLHVSPAFHLSRHLRHRFNSDIPGGTGTALINVRSTVEMSHWHLAVISGLAESPIYLVVEQMESMQAINRSVWLPLGKGLCHRADQYNTATSQSNGMYWKPIQWI